MRNPGFTAERLLAATPRTCRSGVARQSLEGIGNVHPAKPIQGLLQGFLARCVAGDSICAADCVAEFGYGGPPGPPSLCTPHCQPCIRGRKLCQTATCGFRWASC
jgi:hypothetical protein